MFNKNKIYTFKNRFKIAKSISAKIIGLTLLIVILTIISLGFIVSNNVSKEVKDLSLDRNLEVVKGIEHEIESYFDSLEVSLNYLSKQDGFKLNSISVVIQDFEKLAKDDERFLSLFFGTEKGNMAMYPRYLEAELATGYNPVNEEWYKDSVENESLIWGSLFFDEEYQQLASIVAVPVRDYNNDIVGVVGGKVGLSELANLVNDKKIGDNGYLFLTDKKGKVIIHNDESLIGKKIDFQDISASTLYSNKNGSLEYDGNNGRYLASYDIIPDIDGLIIGQIPIEEAYQALLRINQKILIFGIGALLVLIIIISWLINRSLLKPLRNLSDGMQRVAENDLNVELNLDRDDEIGLLASNFNVMVDKLRQMIEMIDSAAENVTGSSKDLQMASDEVGQVSEQVSASIQQVAVGADKQTEQVDGVMVKIKNLAGILKELDCSNKLIKDLSNEMEDVTEQGSQGIEKVEEQMNNIRDSINEVSHGISNLVNISDEIDSILQIINSIVDEINLLALNAAIEAARAGDAGRGFSVVADEIRNLADESSNSADKIKVLIGEIKTQTHNANVRVDEGTKEIKSGEVIVRTTQKIFSKIQDSLQKVVKGISDSSTAIGEASKNSNDIVVNMENITSISEETSASAEEVSAASQEQAATVEEIVNRTGNLSIMAEEMYDLVSRFKS